MRNLNFEGIIVSIMHLLHNVVSKAETNDCQKVIDDVESVTMVAPICFTSSSTSTVVIAQTPWFDIHSTFGAASDDSVFVLDSSAVRFIFSTSCQVL